MKLSDVVSHSGLAGYAVVALVLFVVAAIRIYAPGQRRAMDDAARLPLDDPNDRLVPAPTRRRG